MNANPTRALSTGSTAGRTLLTAAVLVARAAVAVPPSRDSDNGQIMGPYRVGSPPGPTGIAMHVAAPATATRWRLTWSPRLVRMT